MAQDTIVKNKDNPVVINFTGVDLTQATDIQIALGVDTWSLINDPTRVIVTDSNTLTLKLGNTVEKGHELLAIVIIDSNNPNGFVATNECLDNLGPVKICE